MAHKKNGWIRANDFVLFMVDNDARHIIHLDAKGEAVEVFPVDVSRTARTAKVNPASLLTRRYILVDSKSYSHDFVTGKVVKYGS